MILQHKFNRDLVIMAIVSTIRINHYQDSMKLMEISQKLSVLEGVKQASAIMATEANL